jgi:stringent starvation protein B
MSLNQQKRQLAESLIEACPFMLIDATRDGVNVPAFLATKELIIRIGRDPKVMGMPDLAINDAGWSATLSIKGVRHFVQVPWSAVSRIWVGEPFVGPVIIWPEEQAAEKPSAPVLRVVKGGES